MILLDGIIDERTSDLSVLHGRDEVFELFVLEQLLKDFDLSADEIESGWTDGAGDGGIDGFYIFINGHLLDDPDEFAWPRRHAAIDVWLITCKHHATFPQAPLVAIIASIQELFDLSVDATEFHGTYSEEVLERRSFFEHAYRRLSIGRPQLWFNIVYASRGDATRLGESVIARARQIEAIVSNLFSSCAARVQFFGATGSLHLTVGLRHFRSIYRSSSTSRPERIVTSSSLDLKITGVSSPMSLVISGVIFSTPTSETSWARAARTTI